MLMSGHLYLLPVQYPYLYLILVSVTVSDASRVLIHALLGITGDTLSRCIGIQVILQIPSTIIYIGSGTLLAN